MVRLTTIAAFGAAGVLVMGTSLHKYRQYELKNTPWYREACAKVANHKGIHVLVGNPPLKMGDIVRCRTDGTAPLRNIDPEPLYVLKIPIEGKNGKAKMLLWMNYLTSVEEARRSVSSWNVALIEIQIGSNVSNKFIVE